MFLSISTVSHVRCLLDDYGFQTVGWERKVTKYGRIFYIHFEKALGLLLRACELDKVASMSSVKIALTVDSEDLFSDMTHESFGIKIVDEQGIHPTTKLTVFHSQCR